MMTVRWWIAGVACVATVALSAVGTFAQYNYPTPKTSGSAHDEVKTARAHAGFAAKYDSLAEVTLHLRHVLNCLVGPKDKRYNASAGNPCEGQGNGIISDLPASLGKDVQNLAARAARLAEEALSKKTVEKARAAARDLARALEDLQKKIG